MKIHRKQTASFDIDCQKAFTPLCPDELPAPGGADIAAELNLQATFADYRVGSKDAHSPHALWIATAEHPALTPMQAPNMDTYYKRHAEPGTYGFELIPGLPNITDYDYFVWKGIEPDMHPYGNCYHDLAEKMSTGLIEFLRSKQIDTVIAGGLTTEWCVKATVLQLCRAQFKVIVNLAACRGVNPVAAKAGIVEMQQAGAVMIEHAQALSA